MILKSIMVVKFVIEKKIHYKCGNVYYRVEKESKVMLMNI